MQRTKYPRTHQLPYSLSNSSDDVWWQDCTNFERQEVVVSTKIDGECSGIYPDGFTHARSLDSGHHPSRSWLKNYVSTFAHEIPKDLRLYGENLHTFHSLLYTDLPTYFFLYGIYDQENYCLSWNETEDFVGLLGIQTVPVFYRGIWDQKLIHELWQQHNPFPVYAATKELPSWPDDFIPTQHEGYVVRLARSFHYDNFRSSVAKYIGPKFQVSLRVQHWSTAIPIPNLLKSHAS